MFGYVVVNKPELKIREYYEYRGYYCGLCKALQEKSGARGQFSLTYDMTFLALMLSALYEPEESEALCRCIAHPLEKQRVKRNEMIAYVADMNLLLTWYKCKDDVQDEKKLSKALYGKSIEEKVMDIGILYPRQEQAVRENLDSLGALEREESSDIDALSGCFGRLLAEIFAVRQDEWEEGLRKIGFFMGRYIYIMDAYDDLEKDKKNGSFNPFLKKETETGFDDWVRQLLQMSAVKFAGEFERLPILENVEILRNIIYSGVWTKYEETREKRNQQKKEAEEHLI